MGVEHAECRLLALEVFDDADQDHVLDHVGKIAGVEGVAVIHRSAITIISAWLVRSEWWRQRP